jgi:hypothetical protein
MSARKQAYWMIGYTALGLFWWAPYFIGFVIAAVRNETDAPTPTPLGIYLFLLALVAVPASVLLAGALFGKWRGVLVAALYAGIIAALVVFVEVILWKSPPQGKDILAYGILFCSWPLAALVTGTLSQLQPFRSFGLAYATMLVGMAVLIVGAAAWLWIGESPMDSTADIAAFDATVLCSVPIAVPLLAFPLAFVEVIIQRTLAHAKNLLPYLW